MTVIVDSRGPLLSLTIFENWLRHLKFSELSSQGKQRIARGASLCTFAKPITERQQRVERNQTLLIQNRPDSISDQFMHALGFRIRLVRTRQQIDECVLGSVGFARCGEQQVFPGCAPCVEKLRRSSDLAKRPDRLLPGIVQIGFTDFTLARPYLPNPQPVLKRSESIAPLRPLLNP